MHKVLSANVILLHFSPNLEAIIRYITDYVVCKSKYCRALHKLAVSHTMKPREHKLPETSNLMALDFDWISKVKLKNRTLTGTVKLRLET